MEMEKAVVVSSRKKRVCGPCRKRKSRCDCLLPCSTCVARGKAVEAQCCYPEDPNDLERRRREVVTLRSELDRLERIITRMKRSKEAQKSQIERGPSAFHMADLYDHTQTTDGASTSFEDLVSHLQSLIPSYSQSNLLVNVFLEKVNPIHSLIDGEIFLQQHLQFWKLNWSEDTSSLDPHWLATFFSVLGLALLTGNQDDYKMKRRKEPSDDSDEDSDDDMPLEGVYEVGLGWMNASLKFVYVGLDINAKKGEKPPLDSIRALLLLLHYPVLIASTPNGLSDPVYARNYMELAINIANDLHLSRELEDKDDVNYVDIGTPIEDKRVIEDRRRLWWCLIRLTSEMQWMQKGWSTLGKFLIGGPKLPMAGHEKDQFWVQGLHFRTNCAYLLRKAQTISSTRPNRTCTLQQTIDLAKELQGARDALPNALMPQWDGVGKVHYGTTDPLMLNEMDGNLRYLCLTTCKILRPHRRAETWIREKLIRHARFLIVNDRWWKHPYGWASPAYTTLHCMLTLAVEVFEMDANSPFTLQFRNEITMTAKRHSKRLTIDPHVKKAYQFLEFWISTNQATHPIPRIEWTSALEELIPPSLANIKISLPAPILASPPSDPYIDKIMATDQDFNTFLDSLLDSASMGSSFPSNNSLFPLSNEDITSIPQQGDNLDEDLITILNNALQTTTP